MTMTHPQPADRERASFSVWTIAICMVGLGLVGVVADGANFIYGVQAAQSVAAEAARSGGQQLSGAASIRGEIPQIDAGAARQAAQAYIADAGMSGTVSVQGDRVIVDTSDQREPIIVSFLGVQTITVTGHAESRSVRTLGGVER